MPFDEYVIPPAALAIHADGDVVVRQESRELLARELAALVGVEDVWRTIVCRPARLPGRSRWSMSNFAPFVPFDSPQPRESPHLGGLSCKHLNKQLVSL